MSQDLISIPGRALRQSEYHLEGIQGFRFTSEESLAIVGPNASGKSIFVGIMMGTYPMKDERVHYDFGPDRSPFAYQNIKYMSFQDSYGVDDASYYYQQRWNSSDVEGRRRVREVLEHLGDEQLRNQLYELLQLRNLLDQQVVLLSSGELRKFELAQALLSNPRILVMDNPFIGLDVAARVMLQHLLSELVASRRVQVILVLARREELPDFITHVLPLVQRCCLPKLTRQQYLAQQEFLPVLPPMPTLPISTDAPVCTGTSVVKMEGVTISYGAKRILQDIHLEIHQGEKWALRGHNGSGKSTLLSLICADNPQSYACPIWLFGRRRGTGESIWDIKKRMGYVSPELHRAYRKNLPAWEIVASGHYDTVGIYRRVSPEQQEQALAWMRVFDIEHLAQRGFLKLSSGEQRLVMLARAFVKDPELLILDEPLHGLDESHRKHVRAIIERFTASPFKTAIIVTHYAEELPTTITHHLTLAQGKRDF